MKKTVTANVGGINFHLDEDAYLRFSNYLEDVRRSLGHTEGAEEILQDIEGRIAEMFQERMKTALQVITLSDVEVVVRIMGRPDEFESASTEPVSGVGNPSGTFGRKMFRDPDDKVFGGVCSGIGAYFNVDPIWLRLSFAILFFGFGTGFMLYLILWLVIPKARTTADKLRMRGEPVNVANIERNIREEMEEMKQRAERVAETGSKAATSAFRRLADWVVDVFQQLLKAIAKVLAFFLMVVGLFVAIVVFASFFGLALDVPGVRIPSEVISMFSGVDGIAWTLAGGALFIGIPFLAIGLFGIKHLFKTRSFPAVSWVFLGLWLVGLFVLLFNGFRVLKEFKEEVTVSEVKELPVSNFRTLVVKTFDSSDSSNNDFLEDDAKDWYQVQLDIRLSNDSLFHLVQRATSRGSDQANARINAEAIQYPYSCSDSILELSSRMVLDPSTGYRRQNVKLLLLVPEGSVVKLAKGSGKLLYDVSNRQNILDSDMEGRTWKMVNGELDCLDCNGGEMVLGEDAPRSGKVTIDAAGLVVEGDDGEIIRIDSTGIKMNH